MKKKASPKSLFNVVKPICWNINLLGFNFGNEEPAGCVRKIYRLALKYEMLCALFESLILICAFPQKYDAVAMLLINIDMLFFVGVIMYCFLVKEREIEGLMLRLKRLSLGKKAQKSLNKHLVPLRIYSTLLAICILGYGILPFNEVWGSSNKLTALLKAIASFAGQTIYILTLQFPSLICILPCIVACYCRAEMDEAIEDMKKIKSPLRRAKASAKFIKNYHQLNELASDTDRALSTAMYFMKWPFVITFATSAMAFSLVYQPNGIGQMFAFYSAISFILLTYFPLLQYFYLAPLANQISTLLNGAMVEFNSVDDQWLSRDPTSRLYLLHMRMKHVEQLSQMATEEPPFTLFGEVVDHEILYMIILELYDMWNTLSVHEDAEEMHLHALLTEFLKRCVDCRRVYNWCVYNNY